ncbi:MAG: type I-E CRISPR-associated protein Cas5/CasD [Clostridia bacterium]|nr:type I-E CRISPR-associated protein Cas5/CasD [Clostridia bacterium]
MGTLLLRLAAPLQAWGIDSKFNIRQTGNVPSKSGVVGLLAAALGRTRDESVEDLSFLRFGVRIVREGRLLCDYHTVSRNPNPRPALNKTDYVTKRYYLSDAVFIVGFESDDRECLHRMDDAIHAPAFPLFLGRRSCPPTFPISLGISDEGLEQALVGAQCSETMVEAESGKQVRMILDAPQTMRTTAMLKDKPISFSSRKREHGFRSVIEAYQFSSEHDPFSELEG